MRLTIWILGGLLLLATALAADAPCARAGGHQPCTYSTVTVNGKTLYCTTCCDNYGDNCSTRCN